jgi:hypothetical protein
MKTYLLPSLFFRKRWVWFEDPHDVGGVDMITFFSYRDLDVPGFTKSKGMTSIIDLTLSLEEIWERMRKDFIRLQIEKGSRHGIVVKQDENFAEFQKVLEEFRTSKKLEQQDYRVLKANGTLFSAYLDGKMISGGIFIADDKHLRVWMLASRRLDDSAQKSRVGEANRMVLWEAIKYAKERGMEIFDFCGIDLPEKQDDPMPSLTVYKESFGGVRCEQYYYTKVYSLLLRVLIDCRTRVIRLLHL